MRHCTLVAACTSLGLSSIALAQSAPVRYEVYTLGNFGGGLNTSPSDINNAGVIAGTALRFFEPTKPAAFTWEAGVYTNLTEALGKQGYCGAINQRGDLALATNPGFLLNQPGHAYITRSGVPVLLSRSFFSPSAANDLDDTATLVVGTVCTREDDLTSRQAVVWRNDQPTLLGTLGGPISFGIAINNAGVAVGAAETAEVDENGFFVRRAFGWSAQAGLTDLGTLDQRNPDATSFASDVNDLGWIVGSSDSPVQFVTRAFLWREGVMTDLGALGDENTSSFADAINETGLVVGTSFDAQGFSHAVRWGPRGIESLDSLLPVGSPWTLGSAAAINDFGVITGTGARNGDPQAYVLVPTHLTLDVSALRAGTQATLAAGNATPDESVSFFVSRSSGTTDLLALGVRLELASPLLIGTASADAQGSATLTRRVPAGAPTGLTLHFQAAEYTRTSEVVSATVE